MTETVLGQPEPRILLPCAIFTVTDTFVSQRGVDGPASARQARGTVTFQVIALVGAARQPLGPGWTLTVVRTASGAFISDGTLSGPDSTRRRPIGPPLDLELTVTGPCYRSASLPPPGAAGPRLVNLDPAQPAVPVNPYLVTLAPGYGYPFPAQPFGYSIVRGEVLTGAGGPGVAQAAVTAGDAAGAWTDSYLTDRTGQWVFVVPDAQAGQVNVTARDTAGRIVQGAVQVAASSSVTVPPLILP